MASLADCIKKVLGAAKNIPLSKEIERNLLANAKKYLREDRNRIKEGLITKEAAELDAANKAIQDEIAKLDRSIEQNQPNIKSPVKAGEVTELNIVESLNSGVIAIHAGNLPSTIKGIKRFGGLHAGTQEAANSRKNIPSNYGTNMSFENILVQSNNSYMPNGKVLDERNGKERTELFMLQNLAENRKALLDQGYDVVPYINAIEDEGSISYLILDPTGYTKTGDIYIKGAESKPNIKSPKQSISTAQENPNTYNPFKKYKQHAKYFHNLVKGKLSDKNDSKTTKLLTAIRQIDLMEAMNNLDKAELARFMDLIANVYRSRTTNVQSPDIRMGSNELYGYFVETKALIDKNIKQRMLEDNHFLDFTGIDTERLSRNELRDIINEKIKAIEAGELPAIKQAQAQERVEKKKAEWRAQLSYIQAIIKATDENPEDFVQRLEETNGGEVIGDSLRLFLRTHLAYLTSIDPEAFSGMDLYRHTFAAQSLLDGKYTYFTDTTIKYLQRLKDEQVDFDGLQHLFRDPVSSKTKIGKALDNLTKSMELKQVQLERNSGFKKGNKFIQNDVMGGFLQTLQLDAENDKRAAIDEYIKKRTELEKNSGRKFDTKDAIITAQMSRLVQHGYLANPDKALLENINNERQSNENVIQNGDHNEQIFYQTFIRPLFNKMVEGLEDIGEGAYDEFRNTLSDRASAGDGVDAGKFRTDVIEIVLDIVDRYSYSNEIVSEGFHNSAFERFAHYFPKFTISLEKEGDQANPDATFDSPAGLQMESRFTSNSFTAKPGHLKERKGIGTRRHYANNIEYIFERFLTASTFDIHTTVERQILKERLKEGNPVFNLLTEQNKGIDTDKKRTRRVEELKQWASEVVSNALNRGQSMGKLGDIMRSINRAYSRVALSSLHQGVTQSMAAIFDYGIRTGNWGGTFKAFTFTAQNFEAVNRFFKNHARRIYDRALLGEVALDQQRNPEFNEDSLGKSKFMKFANSMYDGADKVILASLRFGDMFSAKAIVLAEYARILKERGHPYDSIFDVDLNSVDKSALSEAILEAEKNINSSDKIFRGEFFTDRRMIYTLFRNSLFAFSGHIMSLSSQFTKAVRDIQHLKSIGAPVAAIGDKVRIMSAILAQTFVFSSGRYLINMGLATALIGLIKELYDDKDGKIAKLKANVRAAKDTGDPVTIEIAESELRSAERIKNIIGRMDHQTTSFDGYFKSVIREELGAFHVAFNGPQAAQKLVFAIPDMFSKQMYDKSKTDQIAALKVREKEYRDAKDFVAADRVYEQIKTVQDTDYLPFAYDNFTNIGIGGLYGTSLGHIYSTYEKGVQAMGGERELNYADFILAAQSLGYGQNDINRFFKRITMIENDMAKERKRLDTEGIPAAKAKKIENTEKARKKAKEKFMNSIFAGM